MPHKMKTNSVVLDSDLAAALGECQVGDVKDITFRVVVDGMKDGLTGTVQKVVGYDVAKPTKKPEPKGKKRAPALREAIGDEDESMGY